MMYKRENERAITMVAMIVTVIVLLVLAGVTINLALGENGIIKSAQTSSNTYSNATKEEQKEFESFDKSVREQVLDETTLVGLFNKGIIKVGDYINYQTPETGELTTTAYGEETSNGFEQQTFNVSNNGNEINWRVLGLGDKDGKLTLNPNEGIHLLLISGSPVQKNLNIESEIEYEKDPYLYMGKAESYVNGEKILNNISKIYLNPKYASDARSINADDINTVLGIVVDDNKVYEKTDESKTNIDTLKSLGQVFYYSEGEYSPQSYLNNKKTAIKNGENYVVGTGYNYLATNYKNRTIGNTTIGELLFNQTNYDCSNSKAYWLASKGTSIIKKAYYGLGEICYDSINIGSGKFNSKGDWQVDGRGVYPIISLRAEVTKDDLQVVNRIEENWNFTNNLTYQGNTSNYESLGMLSMFY